MSWSFSGITSAVVSAVIAPTEGDDDSHLDMDEQVASEGEDVKDVSAAIMNFGASGFGSVLRGATSLAKQMPGAFQATLESLDAAAGGGTASSPQSPSATSTDGWTNDDGIDDLVESELIGSNVGEGVGVKDNQNQSLQTLSALEAEAHRLQKENHQLLAGLRQSKRVVLEEKSRADAFKEHAADLETRLITESEGSTKKILELSTRVQDAESRLTREVEEREKEDEEWQKRIKVMQQDFRTREGSREDRLCEMMDRVSYLERELSQERERREIAESRVAEVQVALGEERDKAADAKLREERALAEVQAISRDGFIESSELANVVDALEKQKGLASEARTRECESREELEGIRAELYLSQNECIRLRSEIESLVQNGKDATVHFEEQLSQNKQDLNMIIETLQKELSDVHLQINLLNKSSSEQRQSLDQELERANLAEEKAKELQIALKAAEEISHGIKITLEKKEDKVEELLTALTKEREIRIIDSSPEANTNTNIITPNVSWNEEREILEHKIISLQDSELKLKSSLLLAEERFVSAEGKIQELQSAISSLEVESKRLISTAEAKVTDLENSLLISDKKITDLEATLANETRKCDEFGVSFSTVEKKCHDLEESLLTADKKTNKLKLSLTVADKKNDALENSLANAEKKIDELETALAIAEEGVFDKDSEHLSLRQELSNVQSELEEIKESNKQSALESSRMVSELEILRKEAGLASNVLDNERLLRTTVEAQVVNLLNSIKEGKSVEEERDSLRESYKRLQSSFDRLQGDYRAAYTREEESNQRIAELENDLMSLRRSFEALTESGEEGKDAIERAFESSNALREEKNQLERDLALAREHNLEMQHDLDEISARSAEQATVVTLLGSQAAATAERLLDAETRARAAAAAEEELSVLRADLLVRDAEISEAHTAISNLQLIVDESQAARLAVDEREQTVLREKNNLTNRVLELEGEIKALRLQVQVAAASNSSMSSNANTMSSQITTSSDSSTLKQLAQSHTRIAQLQQQIHELKEALEDSKKHLFDSDSHSIDRRIAGQLIVTFLTLQRRTGQNLGFGSQRAKDALSVVANVLSLSEPDRDAIGLLDQVEGPAEGPASSAVSSAVKTVGGLFSGFFGGGSEQVEEIHKGRRGNSLPKIDEEGKADIPSVTLGAAFVQFLLAESSGLREAKEAEDESLNDTDENDET
jgi:chemotaxis protein MotB